MFVIKLENSQVVLTALPANFAMNTIGKNQQLSVISMKKPNYLTPEELKMSSDEVNLQITLGLQSCKTKKDVCDLLDDVRLHERKKGMELLNKAYIFADKLHNGQKRDSGRAYTWHTSKVADILSLVTNDVEIICAGYLHDVLEDCPITKEELVSEFGERVANLVFEVTKVGENCFPNLKTRDAFLIKFADRLQNLSDMVTWSDKRKQAYMNKSIFWLTEEKP